MWPEDDLVLISAIEHYSYCPRQFGLIHVEQIYDENVFTLRGSAAHERAHASTERTEEGVRVERGLPLWSDRLGLTRKADVVEFHGDGRVFPVEYKHGPRRLHRHDDLQLCAQALCLEEMLQVAVPRGAIYAHGSRRSREVALDAELREETERVILAIRAMRRLGELPAPVNDSRCPRCSLVDACAPAAGGAAARRAAREVWRLPAEEAA
jgi:CRISPR-associated exonuclease Cas4